MSKALFFKTLFLVSTALLLSSSLFGQARGTISGRITDPAGAVVPGASVTVTNTGTSVSRNATTSTEGLFNVPALDPGVYELQVEKGGFAPASRAGVNLLSDTTLTVDFALSVAGSTQQVEVASEAPLVETTQSEVSGSLQTSEVENLPILNRNFTGLVELIPGARNSPISNSTKAALGNGISFGGGGGRNVETNVDGLDNRDDIIGGPMMNFTLEGIQEFKLISHEFGAQYGRTDGAILEIVTKAGTNRIHGTAFAFGRNDAMTATDYFSAPANGGLGKPSYSRENLGGSFGGPIKKDKLFYFGAIEYTRQNLFQSEPAAFYNQVALLAQALPTLGLKPAQVIPIPLRDLQYTLKGDYQISAHHSLFVRWAQERNHQDNDNILTNHPDLSVGTIDTNRFYSIVGSETWVIGNNSVNTIAFQANKMDTVTGIPGMENMNASTVPPTAQITSNLAFPSVNVSQRTGSQRFLQTKEQIKDDFSHQMGAHALKFGVDFAWYPTIDLILDIGNSGSITFLNDPSTILASQAAWAANPGGCTKALGSGGVVSGTNCGQYKQGFSTPGVVGSVSIGSTASIIGGPVGDSSTIGQKQFGTYVQDDWKVIPRLTLNLGLRYDIDPGWYDQAEGPNSREYQLLKTINSPYAVIPTTPKTDFSPRVGFAWDIAGNGKHVLRGGFGIYFDQTSQSYSFTAAEHSKAGFPVTITCSLGNAACNTSNYTYSPNPATLNAANGITLLPPKQATQLPVGATATWWDRNLVDPYNEQSHIGYTYQVRPNTIISADYTHVLGLHEFRFGGGLNLNPTLNPKWDSVAPACPVVGGLPVCPRALSSAFVAAGLNANQITSLTVNSSTSRSQYNELIVHMERRGQRITYQASYTLAYAYGFGGCIAGGGGFAPLGVSACTGPTVNPFQPYSPTEWGPTNQDERHRVVLSGIIGVPGGIQVAPIFQAGSARPYNLSQGIDCTGTGVNSRLYINPTTNAPVQCAGTGLGAPAGAVLVGLNSQRGDPTWDLDTRVTKFFNFGETRKVGIFAEIYNITNHANFGNTYQGSLQSAAFKKPFNYLAGYPTSRQLQLGARFTF